jgi:glycosyltransferase involved in cell wall biosynthesis
MRVAVDCMILGARPSGVERAVSGLLRGLAQLAPDDLQVTALLAARGGDVPDCATISVSRGPWYTRTRAGRIFHEQAALGSWLRSARMDVVHGAAYVLPLGWDGPSVVTIHDTITLSHPQWCKWANALHYREVMTRSALAADVVLTPSEEARSQVVARLGVARSRVRVAALGVDEEFAPAGEAAVAAVRERYGIGAPYLLCVGNIEPRKNLPAVVEAFEVFAREAPHELAIVGKRGWRWRPSIEAITASSVAGRIRTPGYVADEDLPALYSGADALVQWSLHEGFGLAPLEAMACGTPAVVSDGGALAEVAGEAAEVVPLEAGPEGLADALVAVVGDEARRQAMIERGLTHAASFTWRRHAAAALAAYREAMGNAI